MESEILFVTHFDQLGHPLELEYKCHDSYSSLLKSMFWKKNYSNKSNMKLMHKLHVYTLELLLK